MSDLLKVFETYNLGDKSMLCLWRNGYLSSALREHSRELELRTRLSEQRACKEKKAAEYAPQ